MRFDLQKLDERIKKLQEIRRLATDPETATMLLEFMGPGNDRSEPTSSVAAEKASTATHSSEARELVKEVVSAKDGGSGSGLWTRTRI